VKLSSLVGYAESTVTVLTGLQTDIYNFKQHLVTELSAWSTRGAIGIVGAVREGYSQR